MAKVDLKDDIVKNKLKTIDPVIDNIIITKKKKSNFKSMDSLLLLERVLSIVKVKTSTATIAFSVKVIVPL